MKVYLIHNKNLLIFNVFIIPLSDKMKSVTFYENNVQIYQYNRKIIVQNTHKKHYAILQGKKTCAKNIKNRRKNKKL